MSRFPRPRTIALGLALTAVSCISITSTSSHHESWTESTHANSVAVLTAPGEADLVIFAGGRETLYVHDEAGDETGQEYDLGFELKVMAPGPDRVVWALDVDHGAHRLQFGSDGSLLSNELEFSVVPSEDLAVAADGGSIYVVDEDRVYQYGTDGTPIIDVPINRAGSAPIEYSTPRIAVDHTTGFVHTPEMAYMDYIDNTS